MLGRARTWLAARAPGAAHMEDVIVYELSRLGFGPFFERQLEPAGGDELIVARVAAEHRGAYEVWAATGAGRARLAGRLRLELADAGAPGVGDWVVVRDAPGPEHTTIIERVLARRTVFLRGAAGREARAQVVAANVDLVFAVCGLDADFNLRRIERYLARIWASGAEPRVLLNKADVCDDLAARVAEVERHCLAVPVHVTSALREEGLEPVRACIRDGMTAALVGSSGAGKSTLVNALLGEPRLRTGEVRASDGRGCHVTTHRQLVLLPGGGLLLDTPGMRELELLDEEGIDAVFGDVAELAGACRFRDCRHETEPGCAVREAVEAGGLEAERYLHFRKLEREAQANELRHDEHRRRQAERVWGQLSDEVAQLRKWKGGKP
ncbi:MAG: ribosome small subunit-dependent GTPase A [Polyangiaceae bacterium]|nr:ribosome small subunit-dependent GTPase A [Polyangiaceae bacterium]